MNYQVNIVKTGKYFFSTFLAILVPIETPSILRELIGKTHFRTTLFFFKDDQ